MGITLLVRVCVMLAVHRHPLAGPGARPDPEDDSEGEGDRRLDGQGAVSESTVQVDRRHDEAELSSDQPDEDGEQNLEHPCTLTQPGALQNDGAQVGRLADAGRPDRQ